VCVCELGRGVPAAWRCGCVSVVLVLCGCPLRCVLNFFGCVCERVLWVCTLLYGGLCGLCGLMRCAALLNEVLWYGMYYKTFSPQPSPSLPVIIYVSCAYSCRLSYILCAACYTHHNSSTLEAYPHTHSIKNNFH
jgi:hypothetical protein